MYENIFFGVWFIFGGLVVLAANPKITFSCHRSQTEQQSCKLTRSGIMGSKTTLIPLENLQNAKVETSLDSDSDSCEVFLFTKNGKIRLNNDFNIFNYDLKRNMAEKINFFLENQKERFLLVEEKPLRSLHFIGCISILVGMIVALK